MVISMPIRQQLMNWSKIRYVDHNPNGSVNNIAGICNRRGNVVGMMPHPERASEKIVGNDDGFKVFQSLLAFKH